jgi:UDP-N-acetylmuramate--alanine ligase
MRKELNTSTIYLIGIGGIGMSALARYFRQQGKEVSGYDRTSTPLTRQLETEGMNIHYVDDPAYVPCDAGLVIYTPAIPETNRELQWVQEIDVPVLKRADVLGMIAEDFKCIAIAGTHGKTSISSMCAHIMHYNNKPVTALLGGLMSKYNTNMFRNEGSEYLIAEADEYDRSFLKLRPEIAVISTMAADHLDIYGSVEELHATFEAFAGQIKENGTLIIHESVKGALPLPKNTLVYGEGEDTQLQITDVTIKNGHFQFRLNTDEGKIDIIMQVPGMHNIENAVAAAAVCLLSGMDLPSIKNGLESYMGVKRRFEYILQSDDTVFIDDYAHHPDEIRACISTARALYPDKKITGIFQPHLFSRTRDLADEFAASLDALDEVILLEIYPAREKAIEGIDSSMLLEKIKQPNKSIIPANELAKVLGKKKPEVLVTMGAGDIDQLIQPIKEELEVKA